MFINRIRVALLSSIGFLAATGVALAAVPLYSGTTVSLSGTSWDEDPTLGGTVLEDRLEVLDCGAKGQATVQVSVLRRSDNSKLDLYYRVMTGSPYPSPITSVSTDSFGAISVEVEYRTDGLGSKYPTQVSRSADGGTLTWDFSANPIGADASSRFLIARTTKLSYGTFGSAHIFVQGCSGSARGFTVY